MKQVASEDDGEVIEESQQPRSNKQKARMDKGKAKASTAKVGSFGCTSQGSCLLKSSAEDHRDLGEIS